MEIYIKSRGYIQQHDYEWHKITNNDEIVVSESNLDIIEQYSQFVNTESFSVLLAHSQQQLILYITAMQPVDARTDISKTRIIRNSLVLVGKSNDEKTFRQVAISALRGDLYQKLEDIIEFDDNKVFKVKATFDNLLGKLITDVRCDKQFLKDDQKNPTIKDLAEKNKQELAEELEKFVLPKQEGILVVVSNNVSKSILKNENVWRGLTSNTNIPESEESDVLLVVKELIESIIKINNPSISRNILIFIIVLMCLAGLILIGRISLTGNNPPNNNNPQEVVEVESKIGITINTTDRNFTVNTPFAITGSFQTQFNQQINKIESDSLIKPKGKLTSDIKTLSAKIDNQYEIENQLGNVSYNLAKKDWEIKVKQLNKTGNRQINLIAKNSKNQEIFNKSISINIVNPKYPDSSLLTCEVKLENSSQDLNLYLQGNNIGSQNKNIRSYLWYINDNQLAGKYEDTTGIKSSKDLLKFENLDGEGEANKPKYIIVSGVNLTKDYAKTVAQDNVSNNAIKAAVDFQYPCVVVYSNQ